MSAALRTAGRHGKLAKKSDYRTLRMSSYLKSVPTAPEAVDNIGRAVTATKSDVGTLFPLDGNGNYGNCTICGLAHLETLWEAFLGKTLIPAQSLVEKTYFQLTGGADTGLAELDVLNWWRKNRFNGSNILCYVSVDPSNMEHVKLAISMFGALYLGLQCTSEIDQQFEAQVPWTPGKLTTDGHCVVVPNYNPTLLRCLTWGGDQDMTYDFWKQCVDECYAPVPFEATLPGFSPIWDWSQLNADLRLVTN